MQWNTFGQSLKILTHLEDQSYAENTVVKIHCLGGNATSYIWYKDNKTLHSSNLSFNVNRNRLVIKRFTKVLEGYYRCEGRDEEGNIGKTGAYIYGPEV